MPSPLASSAFDFELQQDETFVSLFDEIVGSPDSYASNTSNDEDLASSSAAYQSLWADTPQEEKITTKAVARPVQKSRVVKHEVVDVDNESTWGKTPVMTPMMAYPQTPYMAQPAMVPADYTMFESFLKDFSNPAYAQMSKNMAATGFNPMAMPMLGAMGMISPFLQQQALAAQMPIPMQTMTAPAPVATPLKKEDEEVTETKRKRLKRSRESSKTEQKEQAQQAPPTSSSPTNSNSGNSSDEGTGVCTQDEKELKRQKRLIKNRESAQASRERKKMYLSGLEKKVSDLSSQNNSLASRLSLIEEENLRLREKLRRMQAGESIAEVDDDEPASKRRRLNGPAKLPLPPLNATGATMNPLNPNFWRMVFNTSSMIQPDAAAVLAGSQVPQPQPMWGPIPSKGVVLFIMVLCVALLVASPTAKLTSTTTEVGIEDGSRPTSRHLLNVTASKDSVSVEINDSANESRRSISTTIQDKSKLQQKVLEAAAEAHKQFVVTLDESIESNQAQGVPVIKQEPIDDTVMQEAEKVERKDVPLSFKIENDNLILTIPLSAVVTKEEIDEKQDADTKISGLARRLLREIVLSLQNNKN